MKAVGLTTRCRVSCGVLYCGDCFVAAMLSIVLQKGQLYTAYRRYDGFSVAPIIKVKQGEGADLWMAFKELLTRCFSRFYFGSDRSARRPFSQVVWSCPILCQKWVSGQSYMYMYMWFWLTVIFIWHTPPSQIPQMCDGGECGARPTRHTEAKPLVHWGWESRHSSRNHKD